MKSKTVEWNRRDFLTTIVGASVALTLHPFASWAADDIDPRVAAIVASTIGIDTHNHIDVPLTKAEMPGPDIDLSGELKKSGLSAICMTFALDYQRLDQPGQAYERFINGITAMSRQLEKNGINRALNFSDLQSAHKKRQPIVVQSIEGCHFLEGQLARVEEAYKLGLRHLGLLHDSDASVPLGDVYTNPARYNGLTQLGTDVIKECDRLGILVDLAHGSTDTLKAALKTSTKPIIISHTGLDTQLGQNPMMAKMMRPRLISKENAKMVADAGGVIGVWTHLADSPLEYAQNIRALVDVVGADHVCIGTDTKLTPAYRPAGDFGQGPKPQGMPPGDKPKDRPDGPPNGKNPNKGRPGERTNEAWESQKAGFYYAVVDAMLKTGFNKDEITKIGGGNFCRIFDTATKVA